jgi:hypothetical protein
VGLLSLPLAPVQGLIKVAEVIQDQVDNERSGRSAIRQQLEDLEEARESGRISTDEELAAQDEIVDRTMSTRGRTDTVRNEAAEEG